MEMGEATPARAPDPTYARPAEVFEAPAVHEPPRPPEPPRPERPAPESAGGPANDPGRVP
jgi:hypothetical protein